MEPRTSVYTSDGRLLPLRPPLASGGEGTVHPLRDDVRQLAKLYHTAPDAARIEKLRWMVSRTDPDLCRFAGWPTDTLHDAPNGLLIGFLMPRFDGFRPAHMLYSPAHRRSVFPRADWAFLAFAARNCAAAFDTIHGHGHVIGDVNQSNVLLSEQALVGLIDCDSFQILAHDKLFRCEVGVSQYTPPELQGQSFRNVTRTLNHDRFGLAVLIFHLLFMGRHPFAGRFLGAGEMPLEKAIQEFRFVYTPDNNATQMMPPPHALPLNAVGPGLAALFERAFLRGSEKGETRPTGREWGEALTQFAQGLRPCQRDAGHRIPAHLVDCPWCALVSQGGPNFFLGVGPVPTAYSMDRALLNTVWQRIDAIPYRKHRWKNPKITAVVGRAASVPIYARALDRINRLYSRFWLPITSVIGLIIYIMVIDSMCWAPILAVGLSGLIGATLRWLLGHFAGERQRRQNQRTALARQVGDLRIEWQQVTGRYQNDFPRIQKELKKTREQYEKLPMLYEAERLQVVDKALDAREAAAREQFLDTKFIHEHKISGIGPGRQVLLASYSIETAADVNEEALSSIKGIGPVLRQTLLDWRLSLLSEFRYVPQDGPPPPDNPALARLVLKYRQLEEGLRGQLQRGATDLEALQKQTDDELQTIEQRLAEASQQLAQAEADLQVMT